MGESIRVFPLSNWIELGTWTCIAEGDPVAAESLGAQEGFDKLNQRSCWSSYVEISAAPA